MTDNLQQVHDDWKKRGFPFYPTNQKWRDEIFNQLVNFRRDTLIDRKNKIIGILVAIQKRRHYVILEFTLCKEGKYNEVLSHNN